MKKGRKFMSKLVNTFLIKVSIKALSSGETFGPPGLRKTIKLFRNIFPRQSCINLETNNQFGPLLCSPFLFFKACTRLSWAKWKCLEILKQNNKNG